MKIKFSKKDEKSNIFEENRMKLILLININNTSIYL